MERKIQHFTIGSYARMGTPGIFSAQLDREAGTLSVMPLCSEVENPSWLTRHANGNVLYVTEELEKDGRLAVLERSGNTWHVRQRFPAGDAPCHITVDAAGETLFVSNYLSGSLGVYRLDSDGRVQGQTQLIQHSGHGPNPDRQEKAHVHSTLCTGDRVFAADLGLDLVVEYHLNRVEGTLEQVRQMSVSPGAGPRHMVQIDGHPEMLYVAGELDGNLYRLDLLSGSVAEKRRIVPGDYRGQLRVSSVKVTGQTLYIGCRDLNMVAQFELCPDGTTGRCALYRHRQETPRDVWMDEQYCITADEGSGGLTLLSRTGMELTQRAFIQTAGAHPACIIPAR